MIACFCSLVLQTLRRNFLKECVDEGWQRNNSPVSYMGKTALFVAFLFILTAFTSAITTRLMSPKFDVRILTPQTPSPE